MQIVLPVAGFGTRLRPQTWSRPKPLVSVAGKTLIDHVLDRLAVLEPERVVFVTGYLGEQIEEHVRGSYGFEAAFVEQKEMLGQSHAILQAKDLISGPVLVLFPDMIFEADLTVAQSSDADVILWVRQVEDPSRFGVVVLEGDRVARLVEKPDEPISDLAVMGIYYFKDAERLIDTIELQIANQAVTKGEFFIADAIQMMIDGGARVTTSEATVWQDAGTNTALLETNRYLLDRIESSTSTGNVIIPPVQIHESASVRESVIGPYASIGPGASVERSVISDSIVDAGANVDRTILTSSIVGRDAMISSRARRVNIGDTSQVDLDGEHDR